MKLLLFTVTTLHVALGASIVDVTCPDSCTCQVKEELFEVSCDSYEFIKKLIPKQISTIVHLNINNASLVNIDSKLKYLKNLNTLDLSRNTITFVPSQFPYLPKLKNLNLSVNHLRSVPFSQLPKNIEVIDVSKNSIENFPKDWSNLKELKTVYFHDNPIDCDCDNLAIYEQMIKANIVLPGNLTCHYPKDFYGRSIESVNCLLIKENLLNSMLGDESGSGENEFEVNDEKLLEDQEQFINAEGISHKTDGDLGEEGSGDEGSGDTPILPIVVPKACHFNCSTAKPIGIYDEVNASPAPDLKESVNILFEDVLRPAAEPSTTTETPVTEDDDHFNQIEIGKEEPMIIKESDKSLVEVVPTNDTVLGEMERASLQNSNSHSVYIVVGLIIALITFLAIYFVNKKKNQRRRNQRKRNKSNENGFGEEMKPLGKSIEAKAPIEQINSKPNESAPLLNGNGKISDDNKVKSQPDDDELPKIHSLPPQPEKVKIIAGELPDSIPKTPLLVHRQMNNVGEIVTTAVNSK